MKILKIAAIVLGLIAAGITGFAAYLGAFSKVEVTRGEFGPAKIVFFIHKGSYRNLANSWMEFEKQWNAAGLKECESLALYLDPPGVPEENLRSVLACRVDGLPDAERLAFEKAFQSFTIPRLQGLTSTFPFKSHLSYMLGPMKVYPEFTRAMEKESAKPVIGIEIYGVPGKMKEICFFMPLGDSPADYQALYRAFE